MQRVNEKDWKGVVIKGNAKRKKKLLDERIGKEDENEEGKKGRSENRKQGIDGEEENPIKIKREEE